ncbi:hypothetical protein GCM10022198_12050 [Klugiella xanthotipulae]
MNQATPNELIPEGLESGIVAWDDRGRRFISEIRHRSYRSNGIQPPGANFSPGKEQHHAGTRGHGKTLP